MSDQSDAELASTLRQLRVVLKSGDYDGADLMQAWCAMMDAADRLEALSEQHGKAMEALVLIGGAPESATASWMRLVAREARAVLHSAKEG